MRPCSSDMIKYHTLNHIWLDRVKSKVKSSSSYTKGKLVLQATV